MKRKSKRRQGTEEAHPFRGLSQVNAHAAGIDIGAEEIGKALTGTWREEHLFVLKQSMRLHDFYTQQLQACDLEIEHWYGMTRPDGETGEVPSRIVVKCRKSVRGATC